MNKIDELIKKLCPNGIEKKLMKEIANISIGEFVHKNKQNDSFPYPVYNGGISNTGYYEEYNNDGKRVLISARGANAGFVNKINGKYWAGNSCYSISIKDETKLDWDYLYYYMKNCESALLDGQQTGSIPSISKKQIEEFRVSIPPLEIQIEIVQRLNCFTEYLKILNEELSCREKQLEYVMKKLLKKDNFTNFDTLGNICNIEKGKTPIQKNKPGIYPLVATTEHLQTSDNYQFDCEAVCLPLISSRGHGVASISRIYYQSGKFALGNILCALIPKNDDIKAEFLRHYLFFFKDQLLVPLMRGGANVALTVDSLKGVVVPIPTIEEQESIINKINRVSLLLDKNNGLPAEIDKRQKQYEYYRDKLLSFKEVEVNE